jgi:hypothetical protein
MVTYLVNWLCWLFGCLVTLSRALQGEIFTMDVETAGSSKKLLSYHITAGRHNTNDPKCNFHLHKNLKFSGFYFSSVEAKQTFYTRRSLLLIEMFSESWRNSPGQYRYCGRASERNKYPRW